MNVFVDPSAFLAVLGRGDTSHLAAKKHWEKMLTDKDDLVCHTCIVVETSALILRRLGIEAGHVFEQDIVPILRLIWATRDIHEAAVSAHLVANRRTLSLVDCVSFEIMRRTGVQKAFAFDRHFQEYGYECV
ncbi:MAG: PIN domain-containing protein [Clostridiales bacterium]|nr:PIN domain-containing protein [Clostridiales bacterium]